MKRKLRQTTLMLVALFTLSLSAYGHETNLAPPANIIPMADKILAEQAEINARIINDTLRGASDLPANSRSTTEADSVVSRWLEKESQRTNAGAESKRPNNSAVKNSHAHYDDIEVDMGGGWCDLCGCWMLHGRDPNGTPQSEIGHPYVCTGGASSQNCWSHYYKYCFSS